MAGRDTTNVAGGLAGHIPVLLDEVLKALEPSAGGIFIDGTFGAGGYSRALLSEGCRVIAIDRDPDAIAEGKAMAAAADGRLMLREGRFGALDAIARAAGYDAVDGVVLDIGVSSMQLDRPERGFSFMKDGPLDMRMGRRGPSAADVVNEFEPRALTRIIAVLGEERHAAIIARAITKARTGGKLTRTEELADVIERAIGRKPGDPIHPATRTFQALRIYVNNELDELADALAAAERILAEGGRLVVVSFHSLEDRIVKRFIAERTRETPTGSRHSPVPDLDPASFRIASRGPVTPGDDEIARNPRARSAKLRAAIRTDAASQRLDRTAIGVPPMPVMRAWA